MAGGVLADRWRRLVVLIRVWLSFGDLPGCFGRSRNAPACVLNARSISE